MSSTLCWEPASREKGQLSNELKFALQKNEEYISDFIITDEHLSDFEGLRDAGIKDAEIIISAIGKYGEIVLSEDY